MSRILWIIGGFLSFALGFIGVFLPLLPTVPLMLLAAFCFAQSSPRLHDWLLNHPRFGHAIQDWRDNRAISRKAKILATVSIGAAFGLSLWLGVPTKVLALQAVVLICVLIFIWSRNET